ncbi:MAG: histidine kinase [Lachnospiraceae bacterium]|nr:histidine kinase [Lachnospiraceae bacterium]
MKVISCINKKAAWSWKKILAILLIFLIALQFFLFVWRNYSNYRQKRENIYLQNMNILSAWEGTTESRLDTLYDYLYELVLVLYNNTEISSGTPQMEYEAKSKVVDTMEDKLLASDYAACFYVVDTEYSLRLFSAGGQLSNQEAISLKNYFYDTDFNVSIGLQDKTWQLEDIGDRLYLVKLISLGKYVVGTATALSDYDILANYTTVGYHLSCYYVSKEKIYLIDGAEVSDSVSLEELQQTGGGIPSSSLSTGLDFEKCHMQVYLMVDKDSLESGSPLVLSVWLALLGLLVSVALLLGIRGWVIEPTNIMLNANQELSAGNENYRISAKANSSEFAVLYDSFNEMADHLQKMRIDAYERQMREQQNELRQLRAQLRPHFFLNAINTVSNMTYQNREEDIRSYLSELARHVRYMLDTRNRFTSVSAELSQIESYLAMQKIAFPNSVEEYIGCTRDAGECKIPYLLLFTVVENAFKHAMSLYEPLLLLIQCERCQEGSLYGCRIIVEDNGKGFPSEVLEAFSPQNSKEVPFAKEHLGLTNVKRTLQLTYHRNDLLRLSNVITGGAHVEIWIPEEEHETDHL